LAFISKQFFWALPAARAIRCKSSLRFARSGLSAAVSNAAARLCKTKKRHHLLKKALRRRLSAITFWGKRFDAV
jgi:hypothetical protein